MKYWLGVLASEVVSVRHEYIGNSGYISYYYLRSLEWKASRAVGEAFVLLESLLGIEETNPTQHIERKTRKVLVASPGDLKL